MNMTFDPPARTLVYGCSAVATFGVLQTAFLAYCIWQDALKEKSLKAAFSWLNISLFAMSVGVTWMFMMDAMEYYTCNFTWCFEQQYDDALIIQIVPGLIYKISYCLYSYGRSGPILDYVFTVYAKYVRYFLYLTIFVNVVFSVATIASILSEMSDVNQLMGNTPAVQMIDTIILIGSPLSKVLLITLDIIFLVAFVRLMSQTRTNKNEPINPTFIIIAKYGVCAVVLCILSLLCYIYYLASGYFIDPYGYVYMVHDVLDEVVFLVLFAMKLVLRKKLKSSKS